VNEVAAYVKARDAVLLRGDVDECMTFLRLHNPQLPPPSSRMVAEMTMHKAITGAKSLPIAYRRASKHWLQRRGFRSFDDGDL